MGCDDWFRNRKWDAATEAHFNEKLRRARDKAQPWSCRIMLWRP